MRDTHAREFLLPARPERGVIEDRGHDGAAVGRRVGIVGAHDPLQLAQHALRLVLAGQDHRQGANTLTVQRERFGERARHKAGKGTSRKSTHGRRVGVDTFAESLVGEIQERDVALARHRFDDLFPLAAVEVDAGRVVAAGMQHENRTFLSRRYCLEHRLEPDPMIPGS